MLICNVTLIYDERGASERYGNVQNVGNVASERRYVPVAILMKNVASW